MAAWQLYLVVSVRNRPFIKAAGGIAADINIAMEQA
jgi:hypothetical protein